MIDESKNKSTIVLGVDPGLSMTGWGVIIRGTNDRLVLKNYGCIKTKPSSPLIERLKNIYFTLNKVIEEYSPEVMAIEELFFSKEARTIASVGQARGAILITAGLKNLPVYEYNPRHVKMALTGYGSADKKQIQQMVKIILAMKEIPQPDDAADALALAICHINTSNFKLKANI
ncbi:MAG: crossover junction endodeoxyribonuclease RuvC [Elusimicrobia bacterium]|nr:crossover junction endodeoxyribonuclease RuvC [Candidatus Liberimonas magnetica]